MIITSEDRREIEQIVDERIARLGAARGGVEQAWAAIREAGELQAKTDERFARLAEAQGRADEGFARLAEAQQRTEAAMQGLARAVTAARSDIGGLSQTMSYSLENEAYRALPGLLRTLHGIDLADRFVRAEVAGEEVNFLARGRRAGKPVLVVGETKLRLAERPYRPEFAADVFGQLEVKVAAARQENPGLDVVPLLVTHFASSRMLRDAEARGVLVIQSFEW